LAIAREIGPLGFARIETHLSKGGRYVGMCAGAYLPLPSSIEPLCHFNISSTKIENLEFERTDSMAAFPRVFVGYGSCSIVHPVRGKVLLESINGTIAAPIYGGPIFREPSNERVLLRYSGFTEKTEFQIDQDTASRMVLDKPAAIALEHGSGRLLLLGPHLEHPGYAEANKLFLDLAGITGTAERNRPYHPNSKNKDFEGAISDLKVAIRGLENRSFLVGNKLWDGGRYMELLDAVEKRSDIEDSALATSVTDLLRRMRAQMLDLPDKYAGYEDASPRLLLEAARLCVNHRFQRLRGDRK